jgi:tRNA U34 2-thiouridine synthase MnmA/TrmU
LDINKKAYVVKIDVEKNLVYVSYDKYEPELVTKHIEVKDWHWI